MSGKLISKEEYELISLFQDSGNYGYECAYGVVNTSAPYTIITVGEEIYLFDREDRNSLLYEQVQEKLRLERLQILQLASL